MFHSRNIVSAVEIGTSKICVLVGEIDGEGRLDVIGRGEAPSAGAVVKGEIIDMERAQEQLRQKHSIEEYKMSKASLARALTRLKETYKE